ncbi:hypothetical protein J8273_0261 [Carpediemonas membranifera]|uniref:Uncharacterized protein n=1 Tax=Carpediemonas membranifera TaxID=201153 RepID=A0A8J6E4X2_9EUKA|nr:hypothetical protein J8273_0261 [Carpediemonas membranifera]|eukprot:KAG9395047.1 hypothetical protein J8273_0261 [Carpediemonas membranifera]
MVISLNGTPVSSPTRQFGSKIDEDDLRAQIVEKKLASFVQWITQQDVRIAELEYALSEAQNEIVQLRRRPAAPPAAKQSPVCHTAKTEERLRAENTALQAKIRTLTTSLEQSRTEARHLRAQLPDEGELDTLAARIDGLERQVQVEAAERAAVIVERDENAAKAARLRDEVEALNARLWASDKRHRKEEAGLRAQVDQARQSRDRINQLISPLLKTNTDAQLLESVVAQAISQIESRHHRQLEHVRARHQEEVDQARSSLTDLGRPGTWGVGAINKLVAERDSLKEQLADSAVRQSRLEETVSRVMAEHEGLDRQCSAQADMIQRLNMALSDRETVLDREIGSLYDRLSEYSVAQTPGRRGPYDSILDGLDG